MFILHKMLLDISLTDLFKIIAICLDDLLDPELEGLEGLHQAIFGHFLP